MRDNLLDGSLRTNCPLFLFFLLIKFSRLPPLPCFPPLPPPPIAQIEFPVRTPAVYPGAEMGFCVSYFEFQDMKLGYL